MERTLRAVIVDDEELARGFLREMLREHSEIEIAAECANGFEAVKAIAETRPDLLFLDVQMPKLDGFEVLELIEPGPGGHLRDGLRPVRHAGFRRPRRGLSSQALQRGAVSSGPGAGQIAAGGAAAAGDLGPAARAPEQRPQRIVVKDGPRVHVIPLDKLDYVEAQDDYVALHSGGKSYLKQQPIASLEAHSTPRASCASTAPPS